MMREGSLPKPWLEPPGTGANGGEWFWESDSLKKAPPARARP